MPINFKIGMQVKVDSPNSYANGATGIITFIHHINYRQYAIITFNPEILNNRRTIAFWLDNLRPLNLTPEEQAQFDEERRQEEECKLDQERRQQHADKYL